MPASAALAFSRRCRASGTLRIWIIVDMFIACSHVHHMSTYGTASGNFPIALGPYLLGGRLIGSGTWLAGHARLYFAMISFVVASQRSLPNAL